MTAPKPKPETVDPDTEVAEAELLPGVVAPSNGQIISATTSQALEDYLAGRETVQVQDPDDVVRGIVARTLEAGSLDELLNRQAVVGLRDLMARTLVISDVRWGTSTYEDGLPFYAIIDAADAVTGEKLVVTTGAMQPMAQLYMMKKHNWLPAAVKVDTTAKPTSGGYYPVWLSAPEPPPEPNF